MRSFARIDGSVSEPHDSEEQNAGDDPAMELKNDIRTILLLNSGSSFADIEKQESHELADQKYLTETIEKLMEDFKRQFSGFPKKFRWSIMRNVMNELPLPFENVNELQQYILSSLVQCKDKTEKRWVFEKIQLWMDEMGTYL